MTNDRNDILAYLASNPGAAISDLEEHIDVSRSTIKRRLREMIREGQVRKEGKGKSTRYFPADFEPANETSQVYESVKERISRPLSKRPPVSYQRSFLTSYEPNRTSYLGGTLTKHLRDMGQIATTDLPAGTYARQILDRLLIDLSWNSSRLEGNTYSLLETEQLLADGAHSDERDPLETQMILNHKGAIEFLVEGADEIGFNPLTIRNLHALLSENLLPDPAASGRLRAHAVGISGSVFYPLNDPHQIKELFSILVGKADAIEDPFEQSFFVLVQLPYLQPFSDVNKRVSRLAANIPFIRGNFSPLSFIDVDRQDYVEAVLAIYELNDVSLLRTLFVEAYERSLARYTSIRETLGEPDQFRLQWRQEIKTVVSEIIRQQLSRPQAIEHLRDFAKSLPPEHQKHFIDTVELELTSLHEGNFARYRVRPSEFEQWQQGWKRKT